MRVLVTGFDPFGGEKINPSYELIKLLPDKIGSIEIIKKEIPTVFIKSGELVETYINKYQPEYILLLGQAGGRRSISFEKVALNLMEARIPDNQGNKPVDKPIAEGADLAYFTSLPIKRMVQAVREEGLEADISYSAGTFVCNSTFYQILHLINEKTLDIKAGFIHIPYMKEQVRYREAKDFYMEVEDMKDGLIAAIKVLEEKKEADIKINLGKIC